MLKRDVSITFVSSIAMVLLTLGSAMITSRMLGPEGRGILAMLGLLPSIVSTFAMLGQDSVNSTLAGLYKEDRLGLLVQSLVLSVAAAGIGVVVTGCYFFWLPIPRGNFAQLDPTLVWIACFMVPTMVFSNLLIALVRGVGRVATSSVLRIADRFLAVTALLIFLVILGQGVFAAVWILTLAPLCSGILALWALRGTLSRASGIWPSWLMRKSLQLGIPLSMTTLAGFLVYRIDQAILGYLVEPKQLGLYVVAVGLAEQLKIIPGSISTAFLPRLANELETRRQQVPAVFRATMIASLAAMLAAAAVGAPLIVLLFGWEFSGSIPPYMLLLPGVAAIGGASILASDLLTRQKPVLNMTVAWTTLAVGAALNILLIPLLGIQGSAVAATCSYTVALLLLARYYCRESGESAAALVPRIADVVFVWRTGWGVVVQAWEYVSPRPAYEQP